MMIILSQDIPGISTNKTTQPLVTTHLAFHVSSKAPTLEDVEEPGRHEPCGLELSHVC